MGDQSSAEILSLHPRVEEDDNEFRSCCGEESDSDESDEPYAIIYFKGVSMYPGISESSCRYTGIGVVVERHGGKCNPAIRVQKKLDFYVEGYVADFLALISALSEAVACSVIRVVAATDSRLLYDQILVKEESCENTLVNAFRERIFALTNSLESFDLKLVSSSKLNSSLRLAMVAIGLVTLPDKENKPVDREHCSICCKDRPSAMMIRLKCSHKFCSHCIKMHVDGKLQTSQELVTPRFSDKTLLGSRPHKALPS